MAGITPWRKDKENSRFDFPLSQLRNEFESLFDRFFTQWPTWSPEGMHGFWGMDMDDTGKEIVVRAEAPGFEPGDFDINITGNTLTIQAERKQESKEEKQSFYSQRRLQRSVTLPAGVDADKVDCRFKNGILELHLRRTEQAQAKRIQVKS